MTREIETDDEGLVRLQKLLAQSGVASRRKCEELMLDGEVEVDGEVVTRLGTKVDPRDRRHQGLRPPAAADERPRLPGAQQAAGRGVDDVRPGGPAHDHRRRRRPAREGPGARLFHVGRLDTDTSGLLLLTNDGDFAHRMAHPSYEVEKTYVAEVTGRLARGTIADLLAGVTLETVRCRYAGRG